MGPFYLLLTLLIQNSCTTILEDNDDNQIESREILKFKPDCDDPLQKGSEPASKDWMDMFIGSNNNIFPTSSAALMAQATFSNKTALEQIEEIKDMADEIGKMIQSEMFNLLSCALAITDKGEDNKLKKKRSIETPMDSTQLVMRLLKHIKCNNEYQNIAIEKMMSAQEIADKYGIEFNPDPEILSDMAIVANEQAKEMSEILKDACDLKNATQKHEEPFIDNEINNSLNNLIDCAEQKRPVKSVASFEQPAYKIPEYVSYKEPNQDYDTFSHYNHYYPYESQIPAPPTHHHHSEPVSSRPNFYDYVSFNPNQEYAPYCSMEPMSSLIFPFDEPILPEPELIGEEYEETVSSKVYIDYEEEPGVSCVNHVMTYTVSEKSHFRHPQIEDLPQQMQYYFFLM